MKFLRFLLIFLVGVALTVVLLMLEIPIWIIYGSIVVLYLLIMMGPQMFTIYKSNNLKRIERYLNENKRKPIFAYPLAIQDGNQEKIIQAVQAILMKYKQPYVQEVYKTNLALHEHHVSKIEQLAKQISKDPLRTYYIAYAEALKGNFDEARTLKANLKQQWMPHAIEALIAKQNDDMLTFRTHANTSIEHARGVQKFNLVYSFANMEK
ncbi:hypothetical protein [Psychrobacillus sp.]|uniref:hypothetical protein n=1 Tax=Psychrobacillus sp. TaxID=1871623 RepID=UPI0028BE166E|nr:hypothetical protein [Psychrobacillus sp.]